MSRKNEEEQIIKRFQIALNHFKKTGQQQKEGLIEEVNELLCFVEGLSVRKVLSEYLYRVGHNRRDWLSLASSIDFSGTNQLLKVAHKWLERFGKGNYQISKNTDEFIFYSSFVQKLTKERQFIRENMEKEEFSNLKRKLIFAVIALSELRDENTAPLFKALVKLNEVKEDEETTKNNLNQMAEEAYENSIFIPGNLLLISLIAGELKTTPLDFLEDYLHAIPIWAADQELASASSSLVVELLKWHKKETVKCLTRLLVSKKRAVVETVIRVWLSRATNSQQGKDEMVALLERFESICKEHFSKPPGRYWPPTIGNIEDFTCVDPEWDWEESTGVSWIEDRLIDAFVKLWQLYYQKISLKDGPRLEINNEFLQAGVFYHDSEIRKRARKLMALVEGGPAFLESIPIKPKWIDPEEDEKEEQAREKVFLPKGVKLAALPSDFDELSQLVEESISLCGSTRIGNVPSLPETQANLAKKYPNGTGDRIVSKIICDAMELVKNRNDIVKQKKIDFIHNIALRIRLKAVVNNGCDVMEEILAAKNENEEGVHFYQSVFKTNIAYFLSTENNIRTLVFSRILWTCCANQPELFEIFFKDHIKPALHLTTPPSILARVLKVVKHFVSQKNCLCSIKSELLSFCLEAQIHDDFLVRSAANIVFGFLLKSMTKPRKCPLFVLIGSKKELWNSWRTEKLHRLSELIKPQRILLLTLLKQYIIVNEEFYCENELKTIEVILDQVERLRQRTGDIRERRFCVDVLIQLTITDSHKNLLQNLPSSSDSSNNKEDGKYLSYRLLLLNDPQMAEIKTENALESTICSNFLKEIQTQEGSFEEAIRSILQDKRSYDNELMANLVAIKLETLAWKYKGKQLPWKEMLDKWVNHPFSRVRSLMARIPVALREEKFYKSIETYEF